jgi:hypothetical protein
LSNAGRHGEAEFWETEDTKYTVDFSSVEEKKRVVSNLVLVGLIYVCPSSTAIE